MRDEQCHLLVSRKVRMLVWMAMEKDRRKLHTVYLHKEQLKEHKGVVLKY